MLFNEPKLLKCSAVRPPAPPRMLFQCSSASRKFLNLTEKRADERHRLRFSALQRAENSSISVWYEPSDRRYKVSVLFSEPKIPQSASKDYAFVLKKAFQCSSASRKFLNRGRSGAGRSSVLVSVLFSEPKIPQSSSLSSDQNSTRPPFSALQRAENSSIVAVSVAVPASRSFQCSSASRKFLNRRDGHH